MELRAVAPEEAEDLSRLAESLVRETYPYAPKDVVDQFIEENLTAEVLRRNISAGAYYAYILVKGELAGFTSFGMNGKEIHLSKLYLLSGFRGMSIGSKILALVESEAIANGAERISLETNVKNEGAIRFYKRNGFRDGERMALMRIMMYKGLTSGKTDN